MSGAALSEDARLLAHVRDIGTRPGIDFDYTDDAATAELLERHRRAVAAAEHGPAMWLGALILVAAVVWPFVGSALPALDGRPELAFAPAGPLLVVAVACLVLVRRSWKRKLLHPRLTGYRHVLGQARAHGVPVAYVPDWLVGRSPGGGRETVPIPSYAEAEPLTTRPEKAEPLTAGPAAPASVPAKPASVASYEAMADEGGWHGEAGCLLLFAAIGAAAWSFAEDNPLGGVAALLAVLLAITTWLAGARKDRERQRLRETAVEYVRALSAAQSTGATVPELSPALRGLLEEERVRNAGGAEHG